MMLLPVLERFAESGWQPFVEPAETYEFFAVSGVFKRAKVDATLPVVLPGKNGGSQQQLLKQRNALFEVCVKSGLAHLIVAYIHAEEQSVFHQRVDVQQYVLKEPIAVQQWVRRQLEAIERKVNEGVAHGHVVITDHVTETTLDQDIRLLNALRSIVMALIERLKNGSRQFAHGISKNGVTNDGELRLTGRESLVDALEETELVKLTREGIQNLLELLTRIQTVASTCHCMHWLEENNIDISLSTYEEFYKQARVLRKTYRKEFETTYGSTLSSVSGVDEPMLLIEHVMQSANISLDDLGGSSPPIHLNQLLQILRAPSIQQDVMNFYGEEIEREPIEGYFRIQVALLMYFCLDRAYLSELLPHAHTGARIVHKMRAIADSLASQLTVRDDMKLTLLALWLVENAVVVKTSNRDQVAVIYEHAINLLQQSSALHLHQKYDLEPDLILHLLETLVHRGESVFAWKVWNTFGVNLNESVPAATELAMVISLELNLWERALTLLRSQARDDLLEVLFNWLLTSNRVKELVQGTTLLPKEETKFHQFMMYHQIGSGEDVLHDENIKRVDLLVMYYALRNKYETAWDVHHEHLAIIREITAGDTQFATTVLSQPSFRIRSALLANVYPEPTPKPHKYRHRDINMSNVRGNDSVLLLQPGKRKTTSAVAHGSPHDTSMEEAPSKTASTSATTQSQDTDQSSELTGISAFDYSPGIFSSRASQPSSSTKKPLVRESLSGSKSSIRGTSTPNKLAAAGSVPIGSIDSSPDSGIQMLTRRQVNPDATRKVVQALDFGSSPVSTNKKASSLPNTPLPQKSDLFGERRQVGGTPIRSKFNAKFMSSHISTQSSGVSMDDLTLKPRLFDSALAGAAHVDVQVQSRRNTVESRTVDQSTASSFTTRMEESMETPKRFQFVREPPMTDSRLTMSKHNEEAARSPATAELEEMELERIDEEFSTPVLRSRVRRKEPASVPVRRNPPRSARKKF